MPPLGYSSNLHPAETLEEVAAQVVPAARRIRELLGWPRLGVDLRLGLAALGGGPGSWAPLRRALDAAGLSAHTLNGFPLLPFQAPVVKERAYRPDWAHPERLAASLALLDAALELGDGPLATISTVPGSFKAFGADPGSVARQLGLWAAAAARAGRDRGRRVVLCLEPEPRCLLEETAEAIAFWRGPLAGAGLAAATAALDGDRPAAAAALAAHLGICFDTCHASLAFEDQAAAVAALAAAGIPVPKCQLSAAPEVRDPGRDPEGVAALRALAEPRFLHQVAVRGADGRLHRADDLDRLDACLAAAGPGATALRAHFHIPVDRPPAPRGLSTTVAESLAGLAACRRAGCTHFAVETYTWSILAADDGDRLAGTARELEVLAAALGGAP